MDWLEFRRTGIGGSEAAVVWDVPGRDPHHPFLAPLTVYLEKRGELPPADLSGNEAVRWGNLLEPVVAAEFRERTGYEMLSPAFLAVGDSPAERIDCLHEGEIKTVYRSRAEPTMLATPDGLIFDPARPGLGAGILEIKTTGAYSRAAWLPEPRLYAQIQAQHYMSVLDLRWCAFAVLIGGQELVISEFLRADGMVRQHVDLCRKFWARVEGGVPPHADGTDSCGRSLRRLWPESNGVAVALGGEDFDQAAAAHERLTAEASVLKKQLAGVTNVIRMAMADNEVAESDSGRRFSNRVNKRGVRVLRALKKNQE